jgi:hypothetical protein
VRAPWFVRSSCLASDDRATVSSEGWIDDDGCDGWMDGWIRKTSQGVSPDIDQATSVNEMQSMLSSQRVSDSVVDFPIIVMTL